MPALAAGSGVATDEVLKSLIVIVASATICGMTTYLWLRQRLIASESAVTNSQSSDAIPDHLDEVLIARACAMGIGLPVTRHGVRPVGVRFSDRSEVFYFERDLETYDRYIFGGLTSLERSTVDDPPRMISEWTRREKVRWLADHPLTMDESGA
jgi:hypothetical protein